MIKLEQNYRSTQTIVEAGNEIMKANTKQMHKTCFSTHIVGEKIRKHMAVDDDSEAWFIADEIEKLTQSGQYRYGDIAILYRTNVLSRLLEDKFMVRNIPYNMVSGFSFYQRREIKDVLSWIQVAVNPDNDLAVERILNLMGGVGKTTIEAMVNKRRKDPADPSLYEVVETYQPKLKKTQAALAGLCDIVAKLHAIYEAGKNITDTPISDMLELVFKYTKYVDQLRETGKDEDKERIANVLELVKIAKGYENENHSPNIQDFLDQIALTAQGDKIVNDNCVNLMTIHASKGLEYPVVFLIGVEEGILPHANSLPDDAALEEERRLAYVGITRTETLLYMTHAQRRMDWSREYKWQSPSRFFKDLPSHLFAHV